MELRTEKLTPAQLEEEAGHIVGFLESHGGLNLTVYLGWGCDVEEEDRYREMVISPASLREFIARNLRSGSFVFGEGDLSIKSDDLGVTFLLCHESDIHVTTNSREMGQEFASAWTRRGCALNEIPVKP